MVHKLSLLAASPYSSGGFVCNICRELGCGPVYHCADCDFDVHVTCAATAKQQTHMSHPQHLLHLVQRGTTLVSTLSHTCDSCGLKIDTSSFRCDICDFDIHPTCVRAPRFIKHPSHPHPLTLSTSSATSTDVLQCNGCKRPVKKLFYQCNTPLPAAGLGSCNYILHPVCASLPTKVKQPAHPQHVLKLLDQPSQQPFSCGGCGALSRGWRFHCNICNFSLDPACATSLHEFVQPPHQDSEVISQDRRLSHKTGARQPHHQPHQDSEVISQDRSEAASSSTASVFEYNDWEAVEKVLHLARELVIKGLSSV